MRSGIQAQSQEQIRRGSRSSAILKHQSSRKYLNLREKDESHPRHEEARLVTAHWLWYVTCCFCGDVGALRYFWGLGPAAIAHTKRTHVAPGKTTEYSNTVDSTVLERPRDGTIEDSRNKTFVFFPRSIFGSTARPFRSWKNSTATVIQISSRRRTGSRFGLSCWTCSATPAPR